MASILILLALFSPGFLAGLYYLKITDAKKITTPLNIRLTILI